MVSYKKILELHSSGKNVSQISQGTGWDRGTIRRVITKVKEEGLTPKQWQDLGEEELKQKLRKSAKPKAEYLPIDFEYVYKEMSRAGVTVNLLHQEYCSVAEKSNLKAYSRSHFSEQYKIFTKANKVGAKIKRKPGDSIELDFAGDLVSYTDAYSKEQVEVTLFIATLSFSKLTYVEAIRNKSAVSFASAVANALHWYGGVPRYLIVDNAKAAVILHSKYERANLNSLFSELADYYATGVVAAPGYTPTAKPMVEDGVNNTYTRIIAPLRNCTFYSLESLNEALLEQSERFNCEAFQVNKNWSRRTLFEIEEQRTLSALPSSKFEVRERATATVRQNCHVLCSFDKYYYSVPHTWIKKKIIIRFGRKDVRIQSQDGQLICVHTRGNHPYDKYVTDASHMPSYLRQYIDASPEYFRRQALRYGNNTHAIIDRLFNVAQLEGRVPEIEYESARGILALSKPTKANPHRSIKRLEKACKSLLLLHPQDYVRISYTAVKNEIAKVIKKELEQEILELRTKDIGSGGLLSLLSGGGA